MEPAISNTENSMSELEVDMENDNTLRVTSEYGLCPECNNPYPSEYRWCNQCNAKRFQQEFPIWTSGNIYIDNFIQETQLNAQSCAQVLEWIPYNRLTNIKYLAKGGFSTVYKSRWLDGEINGWNYDNKQCSRFGSHSVVIKCLNNSSNINEEFLRYLY